MMAELSFGCAGNQHPWSFQKQMMMMSPHMTSQQQNPLRHSIDAILHKTPLSSLSCKHGSSLKPTLPHIETLRRHSDVSAISPSLLAMTSSNCDARMTSNEGRFDDSNDSRDDPSSRSSFDSSEETEDEVVVVDEVSDSVGEEPQDKHSEKTKEPHFLTSSLQQQLPSQPESSQDSDLLTPPSAFKPNAKLNAAAIQAELKSSVEKVKSAFRPIVRPWLAGEDSKSQRERYPTKLSAGKDRFRAVGTMQTKCNGSTPNLRPLDAISMLRRQSSAFRVAFRPDVNRHHMMTTASSSPMENGLGVGQPLPSSLASWFSWLRSGGLHFGTQPPPQQFQPAAPPCRGLLPPSTGPTPPQQAPRYNCEACGKSYSTFGGLSKHKQFHCAAQVKKDFRCKFCDKSYSSLGALKMHIRTHTLPCKCQVCGKAFSRPWLLQGHLRTHTGEKPFSCPHCARAFADRSNLRAHLQTHSDVKKYSCRHCSKTFSRMSLLVKHRDSSCAALHR